MAFRFLFSVVDGETAVDIDLVVADDQASDSWTWLQASRSHPVRLEPSEWPEGLATSVDVRNRARDGQAKGRVLVVRTGPWRVREALRPVAVLCWHVHAGHWPLAVLDLGYRSDLDADRGRFLVEGVLLAALAELNDSPALQDRKLARPADRLGWAIRRQDGAGSDLGWARTVAGRAQREWGFGVVKPKSARPPWAREGFYGERRR